MHLTNTRPLLDSLSPQGIGSTASQTMRRNPSGIIAGESMFRAGTEN